MGDADTQESLSVGGVLNGITYDEPGAMWNDANTYALQLGEEVILFDCGCGDRMDQIFRYMKYWGSTPKKLGTAFFRLHILIMQVVPTYLKPGECT